MPAEFKIRHAVQFVETDMAGIVHFSNFFRWMEACETAFYRSLKLPLMSFNPGKVVGWPRVNVSCEYRAPFRYGDTVEVRLLVKEVRTRAVVYVFQFRRIVRGRPAALVAARGEITAVCVQDDPASGRMVAAPIPAAVRAKLQVAPAKAWAR
ncbi:MAG: acyl-CoA thioesterase [Opitutae bacterium]|nr:acyl-CoA thioesterase [Opitutae bacterium]